MKQKPTRRLSGPFSRFRNLGPLAPRLSFAIRLDSGRPGEAFYRLPFRRSLPVILISGLFLAIFCIPYLSVGAFWPAAGDDSLFSLLTTLFSLFWLLGWSAGVLLLVAVFLLVTTGSETLRLRPGLLQVRIEVLRLGIGVEYPLQQVSNLRWRAPAASDSGKGSADGWRGGHLAFDYGGGTIRVGSALSESRAVQIIRHIARYSGPTAAIPTPGQAPDSTPLSPPIPASALHPSPGNGNSFPGPQAHGGPAMAASRAVAADAPERVAGQQPGLTVTSASTLVLIVANLIPLAGVIVDDWDIGDIMLLFWAESAIIGLFNLARMWVVGRWSVLFLGPFFIGHFGGFMAGHLLFIYALFLSGPDSMDPTYHQVTADFLALWPALLGLLISHGVSFRLNFLGRGEYLKINVREQMGAPYKRIVIMHLTIIFGGFLTMLSGTPLLALLLLVVLKIGVDVKAHLREHRGSGQQPIRSSG